MSTLHIQFIVALYEAIWSYPVYSPLSLGLLATETSLKARIDIAASVQYHFYKVCSRHKLRVLSDSEIRSFAPNLEFLNLFQNLEHLGLGITSAI